MNEYPVKLNDLSEQVVNYVLKRLPYANRCDVEAAFWHVLLNTLRLISEGKEIQYPKAYLITSVYHEVINRPKVIEVEYNEEALGDRLIDPDTLDLCKGAHLKQVVEVVGAILSGFSETDQRIFTMRAVDEVPFLQIGETFGISEGNARLKYHRIRLRILNDPRFQAVC